MMKYYEYYRSRFKDHLNTFMARIPEQSRHHNLDKTEFTIQYHTLTGYGNYLDFMSHDELPYFATALFFTVLVDQVCYTYYNSHYHAFRQLTMYPKFIGVCPSACSSNLHPAEIFDAINYCQGNTIKEKGPTVTFSSVFNEAVLTMKVEVLDYFREYQTQINGTDFWKKCEAEFPHLRNIRS